MKLDIITIGTATKDIYLASKSFKVLKDPVHLKKIGFVSGEAQCFALGSKIEIETIVSSIGGGATNTAITFARQGLKTGAVVRIGKDSMGDEVCSDLKKEKVSAFPIFDSKKNTGYSTLLLTNAGERTVLVYRGASHGFRKNEFPKKALNTRWAYIVPGTIEFGVMEYIISLLKKNNIKIAMNPSSRYVSAPRMRISKMLGMLDVVIVNREEASVVTGIQYKDTKGIFKKFDKIVPGLAIMTDGPRGVFVSDGKVVWSAGIFDGEVVDRTGAGDSFGSGFVSVIARGGDVSEAIRVGTANATSVVKYIGAQKGILKKSDLNKKRWKSLDIKLGRL